MKMLYLDIETFPNTVFTWGLFNQNVGLDQIVASGRTACWAAKWEGERTVLYSGLQEDTEIDMVTKVWHLLDEADIVVHYNGRKFDIPILNKEFIQHGLRPPTPYQQVDLLETARRQFRFVSNKLDYVAQFLGLGAKLQHKGMKLWVGCMDGDPADWRKMKKYNIQDVHLLPKLYKKLLPWINNHPNMALYSTEDVEVCTNCGSDHLHMKGMEHLATQSYQRYKCVDCGTNLKGRTTALTIEKRRTILTQSKL
jgi:uncharacterized protein YprB with RNaseH-like and TPR domain